MTLMDAKKYGTKFGAQSLRNFLTKEKGERLVGNYYNKKEFMIKRAMTLNLDEDEIDAWLRRQSAPNTTAQWRRASVAAEEIKENDEESKEGEARENQDDEATRGAELRESSALQNAENGHAEELEDLIIGEPGTVIDDWYANAEALMQEGMLPVTRSRNEWMRGQIEDGMDGWPDERLVAQGVSLKDIEFDTHPAYRTRIDEARSIPGPQNIVPLQSIGRSQDDHMGDLFGGSQGDYADPLEQHRQEAEQQAAEDPAPPACPAPPPAGDGRFLGPLNEYGYEIWGLEFDD